MSDPIPDGRKFDAGKLMWHLVPWETIEGLVEVLTYGAIKYDPHNWKQVPEARDRYFSALMRHLVAWWQGERDDPDSGLHHLKHALTNLVFLLYFELENEKKSQKTGEDE